MIDIFLSASVPLPERDRHYFETADVLAIRESIKALVEIVIPNGRITYGGHPTITPLLAFFVREAGLDRSHLTIFQSQFFEHILPEENSQFQDVRMIGAVDNDRERSLYAMRTSMIESRSFHASVFIGGMEGVMAEAELFAQLRPGTDMLPIASTGAAALDLFQRGEYWTDLATELTYPSLFRRYFLHNHSQN